MGEREKEYKETNFCTVSSFIFNKNYKIDAISNIDNILENIQKMKVHSETKTKQQVQSIFNNNIYNNNNRGNYILA